MVSNGLQCNNQDKLIKYLTTMEADHDFKETIPSWIAPKPAKL